MFVNIQPDDNPRRWKFRMFEGDLQDARGYFHRAERFSRKGYSHGLVFNLAAMALERYLVALCHLYGAEPENHNFTCLMDAVERIIDFPPELNNEIRRLDTSIFGICSLDEYYHGEPQEADTERIMTMCRQVQALFDPTTISSIRAELGMDEGDRT